MGHNNISCLSTLVLVLALVFAKIDLLNGRCVDYVLSGDACECPKPIPFGIAVPVPKPPIPSLPQDHIYTVEVPSIQRAKVKYSLDFQVEQPAPPLAPPSLPGPPLSGYVDRIEMRKPDCLHYPTQSSCSCGTSPCSCRRNFNSCSCGKSSCSCGSKRCSCGTNPCSCGDSKCSCGTSPCSCSSKGNFPFFKACGMNYQVPVNFLRVRRDLGANKDIKNDNQNVAKEDRKPYPKKISKREIYELNEDIQMSNDRDHNFDLRIPEVIQYMPEVLSSNFERGKCFACQNSKTSCNHGRKYGDVFSCEPKVTPVDHIPNYVEYIHGSPVSYEPRMQNPKESDEPRFVYDRLGHKYEKNQGRLKLVAPSRSADDPVLGFPKTSNPVLGSPKEIDPVLGSPKDSDPKMENLIRAIIRSHPDFIEASDYGPGTLTPSAQFQNREAMAFLRRILGERMAKAFHRNMPNYGNNYSYEDSSLERPYRSPEATKQVLENSQHIVDNRNSFSLEESIESPLQFQNTGETNLQTSQGNEIHLVKFKKDGKLLQVLTSNSRN